MATTTKRIRYNLNDRGRAFRGKPRNFDIPRLVATINGGAVQEKVKHRDMLGYYGHWPRLKFGMNPAEGGIVNGKQVNIEPALVTTYLRAELDGTVEHEAEFLDNGPGKVAFQMYSNKTGGFSSAIDESRPEFYGFDYVCEPNFTTNRGYSLALDGLSEADGMTLDDVAVEEYNQQIAGILALMELLQKEHARTLDSMAVMEREHSWMVAELARGGVTLDDMSMKAIMPVMTDVNAKNALLDTINGFDGVSLGSVIATPKNDLSLPKPAAGFLARYLSK